MADDEAQPIESYDRFIAAQRAEAHRLGRPSRILYNKSPAHASVLIRHLILSAQKQIRILSGSLNAGVYSDARVISAALAFLQAGGQMRVLLDLQPSAQPYITLGDLYQTNPLLSALRPAAGPDQLSACMVPKKIAERYAFHFLVADELSFRFEQDRQKFDAIAQFGNAKFASSLKSRFDEIWHLCHQPSLT